jgi:hypothetical protein
MANLTNDSSDKSPLWVNLFGESNYKESSLDKKDEKEPEEPDKNDKRDRDKKRVSRFASGSD